MHYRPEIDGLRTLAVVPVILFHAGFAGFGGGFVGVDIFFVISGYLITAVIVEEQRAGRFSLLDFYERRMRRILPALYLVMLVCIPIAWFTMLPDDLENFGQSLVATTLFANNVLLWKTSGYWDQKSEFKPLLHTWSLGVEEQYYVLFPLLLMLLWHGRRQWLRAVLLAVSVASLAAAQWYSRIDENLGFYLLPTRAWELLCGALAAITLGRGTGPRPDFLVRHAEPLAWLGLLATVAPVVVFGRETPSPSLLTLVPVLGSLLIIATASKDTAVGRLLGTPLFVGIGLISYSAYLWHQPILAFVRLLSLEEPGRIPRAAAVALTFVLAWLSWRFVEQPFRNRHVVGRTIVFVASAIVGAAIAATGLLFHVNSGFTHRWKELQTDIAAAGWGRNIAFNESAFRFKKPGFSDAADRKILVFGNSFARDLLNAAAENGYFSNSDIVYDDRSPSCMLKMPLDEPTRALVARADVLIYGSPIDDVKCWHDDLAEFTRLGAKRVIVLGPKNFGWNLNAVMNLPEDRRYTYRVKVLADTLHENTQLARAIGPEHFVDLLKMISDDAGRVPVFTPEGMIISQDRVHLTQAGAGYIGRVLFEHPLLRELK